MLRDLQIAPVYDSADCSLVDDLVVPLLQHATEYYRGVGYFTSGWLAVAVAGVVSLATRHGSAHFIVSPLLNEQDARALATGDSARRNHVLKESLARQISDLTDSVKKDTLNALAWLVADGTLSFRVAVPRRGHAGGDYHDKVGVFSDGTGDRVAIHGSFNDTLKGTLNGEAFSVFCSWMPGQSDYVERHRSRLVGLWHSGNAQFEVLELPSAIRQKLVEFRSSSSPPYGTSPDEDTDLCGSDGKQAGGVALRPYQEKAVEAWFANRCRGIFEMATGTGKTFTALAAARKLLAEKGRIALLILVPYQHLVEQWSHSASQFGFSAVPCSSASQWRHHALSLVQDFSIGGLDSLCFVAVHQTSASAAFGRLVSSLPAEGTLVIADEMHALGAPGLQAALRPDILCRLGLSATPSRWYDDTGTDALLSYFDQTVFDFPLADAIGRYLVPYEYHPTLVSLVPEEQQEYERLTLRLASLLHHDDEREEVPDELKRLLIARARVTACAEEKLPAFRRKLHEVMLQAESSGSGELRHVLVYCAPSTHRAVLRLVADLGLRAHEFVSTVNPAHRQTLLKQFQSGLIQVLVAINCLDEGVDIPETRTAFFLASTTNPRQFVQRRGRVLRMSSGKEKASIHDFIVVPDAAMRQRKPELSTSMLVREMARFCEFARLSLTEFQARRVVRPVLDSLEACNLLDEEPWEIMNRLRHSDSHEVLSEMAAERLG